MASITNVALDHWLLYLVASSLLYLITLAFYRLYLHPLAKFPGPKLAAVTRYYEFYYDVVKSGAYMFKIGELHEKYGPIVRISPHELHINDPEFHDKLYRNEGRWEKYRFPFAFQGDSKSIAQTINHDVHRLRRAALNPFFSKQKIAFMESAILDQVEKLSRRIEEFAASGRVLPLGFAYSALTMDIITEYAMEKTYGNLDYEDFNQDMVDCIRGFGKMWRLGKHMNWLPRLMSLVPPSVTLKLDPKLGQFKAFQEECKIQTNRVMAAGKSTLIQEKSHKTIFHEILDSNILPDSEKTFPRLRDEALTIIGAGTDSAAYALRVVTFHLLDNPAILQRLLAELKTVDMDSESPRKLQQLEKLPYFTAVLMEGLRLSYGVVTRLARIAPDRVIEYEDWKIPAGTPVGMTSGLLFHNEANFPDSWTFNPERYTDPEKRKRLDKYWVPFSKGPRNCLGMNLSWAELYLTIATLFSRFEFTLYETGVDEVRLGSDQFVAGVNGKNGVRVTVRKLDSF